MTALTDPSRTAHGTPHAVGSTTEARLTRSPIQRGLTALALALALVAVSAGCRQWPAPPRTTTEVVVDTLHGVAIPDPYRWLEEQDAPEVREWIAEQNAYARRIVSDTALQARLRTRLTELMDVPNVGRPRAAGEVEVFTMRRAGEPQARIYARPQPDDPGVPTGSAPPEAGPNEPDDPDPELDYEVLVDPAAIGPDDAVSVSIVDVSPDGGHMLYSVRDGGRDEISVRLYDVAARGDLPDSLPQALYGSVGFDGEGTGFYYVHRSRTEGPRVRHHEVGTPVSEDEEIWGDGYGPTTFLSVREIADGRYLQLGAQHGWASNDLFLLDRRTGEVHTVIEGESAHLSTRYEDGRLLLRTNLGASYYRVMSVPIVGVAPSVWSDRSRWREVLPGSGNLLRSFTRIGDRYYAHYLDDANARIIAFEEGPGGSWRRVGRVPVPPYHSASLRGAGRDAAILTLSSFDVPSTEYDVDLNTLTTERRKPPEVTFDGRGITTQQVYYHSADGTGATMFITHRTDVEPDGNLPVLLNGYGGFNVAITPGFRALAAVWVEAGGVYAVANLRGGSEYGETWHRAGMLGNKQNVFDDFIAAAEWLIDNGYTNPGRLAITGSSNGGLLVASAFTQRPELYRAVFCGFPDLDMVRFFTFTETNNMPALLEYGDASDPEQFEFLRAYSPYQAVEDGVAYPAVMLTQGDLDTRVPPLQARKMTARLQEATSSGLPVILRYDERAGHAGGRPRGKLIEDTAMELTFLMMQLGMDGTGPEPDDLVADNDGEG